MNIMVVYLITYCFYIYDLGYEEFLYHFIMVEKVFAKY